MCEEIEVYGVSKIIGWTDPYNTEFKQECFGESQRQALIGLIRKREYNFTFQDHLYMPYCTPVYKGDYYCTMSKSEFYDIISEAYKNRDVPPRKMPMDVLKKSLDKDILLE